MMQVWLFLWTSEEKHVQWSSRWVYSYSESGGNWISYQRNLFQSLERCNLCKCTTLLRVALVAQLVLGFHCCWNAKSFFSYIVCIAPNQISIRLLGQKLSIIVLEGTLVYTRLLDDCLWWSFSGFLWSISLWLLIETPYRISWNVCVIRDGNCCFFFPDQSSGCLCD